MWFIVGIIVAAIAVSGIAWLWINHPPKEEDGLKNESYDSYYYKPDTIFDPCNPMSIHYDQITNPAYGDMAGYYHDSLFDDFFDDNFDGFFDDK